MRITRHLAIVAALAAAAGIHAMEQGGSQSGSTGSAPPPSQDLMKLSPEGRKAVLTEAAQHEASVASVEKRTKGDFTFHVVTLRNQDGETQLKVGDQGRIVQITPKPTAFEDLPQAVRQAALQQLEQQGPQLQQMAKQAQQQQQQQQQQGGQASGPSSGGGSSAGSAAASGSSPASSGGESQAMITEIVTSRRDGQTVYRIEIEAQGHAQDLVISADGKPLAAQNPKAEQQVQQQLSQLQQQGGSQSGSSGASESGGQSAYDKAASGVDQASDTTEEAVKDASQATKDQLDQIGE